jgi:hypothetical protein
LTLTLWISPVLISLSFCLNSTRAFQAQDDEKLERILGTISATSKDGLKILDKVQDMKPEVNARKSTKTLIDIVQDYAFNKGAYNIAVLGWAASRSEVTSGEVLGRWKIVLYYRDWEKQHQSAEWEYNEETNKLYPFEKDNAPGFWSNERPAPKKRSK